MEPFLFEATLIDLNSEDLCLSFLYEQQATQNAAEDQLGVFRVPIKIKNWQNKYLPPEKQGEDVECEALVDSGAVELALPIELVDRLKWTNSGQLMSIPLTAVSTTIASLGLQNRGTGKSVPGSRH